jgi:branched-chain amino acid transport system permease protein
VSVDLARDLYLLVAVLGLSLPVTYAGMPVLGQGAFVAVGAFGVALLGPLGLGLPLGIAVLAAIALAAAAGWLVAGAAARLEGAALGLATWALAWLVAAVLVAFPSLSGGAQGLVRPSPAHLVSPTMGLDLVLLPVSHVIIAGVAALLLLAAMWRLESGPAGLDLAALRENPHVAAAVGIPVAARRRSVMAVAAGVAGFAGAGLLTVTGVVAPGDVSPLLSLQLLVAVLAVPLPRWWAPLVGAAVVGLGLTLADRVAEAAGADPERARGLTTAVVLVLVLVLRDRWHGARRMWSPERAAEPPSRSVSNSSGPAHFRGAGPEEVPDGPLLEARGLAVSFGGVRALDGVDLDLAPGRVHALIGPNGSGKSTLLRVLAGSQPAHAGSVVVGGAPAPRGLTRRVLGGVVRTPQHTVLVPGLTVSQQVAVGARGGQPRRAATLRHLVATPSAAAERADRDRAARSALLATGLQDRVDAGPATLAVGEQRLLQIARALATGARVLLLDEPAAGMTADERQRLVGVLRALAGNGRAVLLVEHDMALVGRSADTVTVLDQGRVVASGTPAQVRADPGVQRAYLGEE